MSRGVLLLSALSLLLVGVVRALPRSLPGASDDLRQRDSRIKAASHIVNGRRLDSSELSYVYINHHTDYDSGCTGDIVQVQAAVLDLCMTFVYADSSSEFDNHTVYTKTEMTSTSVTTSYYKDDTCTETLTKLSELYKVESSHSRYHSIGEEYMNGTRFNSNEFCNNYNDCEGTGTYTQMASFSEGSACASGSNSTRYFSVTRSAGLAYPSSDAAITLYYTSSDKACSGTVYFYSALIANTCWTFYNGFTYSNASFELNLNKSTFSYSGCSNATAGITVGPFQFPSSCSYNNEGGQKSSFEKGYSWLTAYYANSTSPSSTATSSPTPSPVTTRTVFFSTQTGFLVSMTGILGHVAIVLWLVSGKSPNATEEL